MSGRVRMMRTIGVGAAALFLAVTALADESDEAIIAYRQKVMMANGANMGAIGDILKFKLPYEKDIAGHARALSINAKMIPTAFEKPVSAGKTDAKPEIWKDFDDYKKDANKLVATSDKLAKIAEGGDMKAVMAQVKEVGNACQHCHEEFRKPKEQSYKRGTEAR
jgi:cytochrome c556